MFYLIFLVLVFAILLGPQLWVSRVLRIYNSPSETIPGSGAEFAKHLIKKLELSDTVTIEETSEGDHYDTQTRTVRLNTKHYNQHSIAAIAIAAHEVGHAIQHAENNLWLAKRQRLATLSRLIEKVAPIALAVAPVLLAITKSPIFSVLMLFVAVLSIGTTTVTHLVTLPVEFDASFNKALPILKEGEYFSTKKEQRIAHKILKAAAMTYVAQSLYNLLNIGYWLRAFRR